MESILWLALLIICIIAEAETVSMVSVWFALGSLAALIGSLFGATFWLQVILFVAVSGVTLALFRPVARKHFTPKLTKTNMDAMAGKLCMVITSIDNSASCGQVKLGDIEWSARSTGGEPIAAGTHVRVDRVEGVKVYVSPVTVRVN